MKSILVLVTLFSANVFAKDVYLQNGSSISLTDVEPSESVTITCGLPNKLPLCKITKISDSVFLYIGQDYTQFSLHNYPGFTVEELYNFVIKQGEKLESKNQCIFMNPTDI